MQIPDALDSAATGMRAQTARLDSIAEDLAHAATPGYRAQRVVARGFGAELRTQALISRAQGSLRRTGVPTDLALIGSGYFAVAGARGVEYTRDGRMSLDADGLLRDVHGRAVLGALGAVRLGSGAVIHSDGRIFCRGAVVDRLRIVDFDGTTVRRGHASVRAGYLEESGVDPIEEMTSLVAAQRCFEADQKAAQQTDETLKRAVTELPAVRS
ncbi:MAG: flagellar hook-basal body complex protein [Candidatus Eremiobacteraeota bacterium]|nr:flagellar hook-basal body complex protein [Candidatus Eremiobacteraeota bacterium]MBV8366894.1 flagellar hook-basal body complex protein [Candidatus Eremiobacteraeota bacterium]